MHHSKAHNTPPKTLEELAAHIKLWANDLGFQQAAITDTDLSVDEPRLQLWLDKGYHADMNWLAEHGNKRTRPHELLPGTLRVISARMNYMPSDTQPIEVLKDSSAAYISRYALGRDYHKLIRKRLSQLANKIQAASTHLINSEEFSSIQQRPFVDSAPVMERPLAAKAGLGWTGKHTLLINSEAGSWFFLGEILTNLPLPIDQSLEDNQCGDCEACLKICPTDAFPKPYTLDANRCISYLTIENQGVIAEEFREPIGNRVFGCDDCQAVCPWNKYANHTAEADFSPRQQLDNSELITLFQWTEQEFLQRTEGSAIRRTGYQGWQRNLAIGLGNADTSGAIITTLNSSLANASDMVQEHILWALQQHQLKQTNPNKRRKRKIRNIMQ
jgi:epoxyqueuosine reductase